MCFRLHSAINDGTLSASREYVQYIFIYFWCVCVCVWISPGRGGSGAWRVFLCPVAAETLQWKSALLVLYANIITGQMLCGIQTKGLSQIFYDFGRSLLVSPFACHQMFAKWESFFFKRTRKEWCYFRKTFMGHHSLFVQSVWSICGSWGVEYLRSRGHSVDISLTYR